MFKKILFVLALMIFPLFARAEKGVNLFAYSREISDTNLYNRYGKAVRLRDFSGDFLIVVFWSRTCIPCLRELDDLNEFVKKTAGNGIKVILVSPENEWIDGDEQKAFLKRYGGQNLDFYVDRKEKLAFEFGIFTSPHTVLINANSMEIGRIRGAVDWDDKNVIEYMYRIKAQH